jgi:hypothetical protein
MQIDSGIRSALGVNWIGCVIISAYLVKTPFLNPYATLQDFTYGIILYVVATAFGISYAWTTVHEEDTSESKRTTAVLLKSPLTNPRAPRRVLRKEQNGYTTEIQNQTKQQ